MQKQIENLGFVKVLKFDFIDSVKNNGRTVFLIFDDSCDEHCKSKPFVEFATAGRHHRLSIIFIKHNLFHQSNFARL